MLKTSTLSGRKKKKKKQRIGSQIPAKLVDSGIHRVWTEMVARARHVRGLQAGGESQKRGFRLSCSIGQVSFLKKEQLGHCACQAKEKAANAMEAGEAARGAESNAEALQDILSGALHQRLILDVEALNYNHVSASCLPGLISLHPAISSELEQHTMAWLSSAGHLRAYGSCGKSTNRLAGGGGRGQQTLG